LRKRTTGLESEAAADRLVVVIARSGRAVGRHEVHLDGTSTGWDSVTVKSNGTSPASPSTIATSSIVTVAESSFAIVPVARLR